MTKEHSTPQELTVIPDSIQTINAEDLISKAIEKNVPVESLERLLVMAKEMHAIMAKRHFDIAMAAFQAECPTIKKTKGVETKSGKIAYRYAPIDSIVDQVKEFLRKNGFSYSTSMELLPTGVKVTVKVTHKDGHSEITPMEVPLGNKTDIMSQSQVVAAAQTFAKRYAFCNAFGILTGDEDNDGARIEEEEKFDLNTSIISFGKHKGTLYKELPEDYLRWLATNEKATPEEKQKAQIILQMKAPKPSAVEDLSSIDYAGTLLKAKTLGELATAWNKIPKAAKNALEGLKNSRKDELRGGKGETPVFATPEQIMAIEGFYDLCDPEFIAETQAKILNNEMTYELAEETLTKLKELEK